MSVRVRVGISQFGGDSVFQPLGNEVLQPFGFFMYFIPRIVQNIMKKSFQQPVMAQNFHCAMFSRFRQEHPVVLFVLHERGFLRRQPLKHPSHRGRTHTEPLCQRVARDPLFFRPAQLQYCFQVIVHRFGMGRGLIFSFH